jgi:D-proline reductase (dithiol) PrdB
VGVGTVRTLTLARPLIGRNRVEEVIVAVEPGQLLAYRLRGGAGPFASAESHWRLQAEDDGTLVIIEGRFTLRNALLMLLVCGIAKAAVGRALDGTLRELAAYAEGSTQLLPELAHRTSTEGTQDMTAPRDASRAALESWLHEVRPDLEHKDLRAAFGARYPRLNLEVAPVPWTKAPNDLRRARLTLVGSSGLYLPGQQPFDTNALRGDFSWRPIPLDADLAVSGLAHEHYDHTAADGDRNSVFPLDRLRELASFGEIGGLTATNFGFSGYMPDWTEVADHIAPALAEQVIQQQPDAALPRALASRSLSPTTATCGSVKIARGITVWSTRRCAPVRALLAAIPPLCASTGVATWLPVSRPITSPASQMCDTLVLRYASTTTVLRSSSWTPTCSKPRAAVFGRRPAATSSFAA